jgi:diaminopimelate epimerase
MTMAMSRAFIKMHGLGNDFVIVDAREDPFAPDPTEARIIADRRQGVGCDQLIILEPPRQAAADLTMRILNADGGEAEACGNATRCVASLVMAERPGPVVIETSAGLLAAEAAGDGLVSADMGKVRSGWEDIPLSEPQDTLSLDLSLGPLKNPVAVSIGNPHAVFFVPDCEAIDLALLGPQLEHHPMFPERANISVVTVTGEDRVRMRVWERGGGITMACGSGACAVAAAAARRGLTSRKIEVLMDGGPLQIHWRDDDHVIMTGPVAISFTGTLASFTGTLAL